MSNRPTIDIPLCGNCKFFVAGGSCSLVDGSIDTEAVCDLHDFGDPQPIGTPVDPTYNKAQVNYKMGFFAETTTADVAQKAIQMEHELMGRGISEEEAHRAVIAYFSQREPPYAMPWPGPITGVDLAGRVDPFIVPDTGTPLTDFTGLPKDVQPFPTPNVSPYGIGSPYPSNPTPDPNSLGSVSNTYSVLNPPYPEDSAVWNGLATDVNSQPSMHGEHGFNVAKAIPEWRYPVEQSQMYPLEIPDIIIPPSGALMESQKKKQDWKKLLAKWAVLFGGLAGINALIKNYEDSGVDGKPPTKPLEVFAEYEYHGHDNDDECAGYSGKRFNILQTHNRPVIPSENLGYTTTHPNCKCTWKIIPEYTGTSSSLSRQEESDIHSIESNIKNAANDGTLHTVKKDGKLSSDTRKTNPMKESCACQKLQKFHLNLEPNIKKIKKNTIWLPKKTLQEAISNLRSEFNWLEDDYIYNAKKLAEDSSGTLYLIRAAAESITDHRGEGEPYRRKLSSDELNSMARTAIGKKMDINHQPELQTDATVLDAEFDSLRKEIQMLVVERDPQINQAIQEGKITAVSINGGMPRSETIEPCEHGCLDDNCELCIVPKGVVLGELDDIAMTWVVTDPNGLYWNGRFVSSAIPGIKITAIETV